MPKKIILVEKDKAKRLIDAFKFEALGYEVKDYEDAMPALGDISEDGKEPFVLVCPFEMGDAHNDLLADEVRRCLDQHTRKTGVRYGMVVYSMPNDPILKRVLEQYKEKVIVIDEENAEVDEKTGRVYYAAKSVEEVPRPIFHAPCRYIGVLSELVKAEFDRIEAEAA